MVAEAAVFRFSKILVENTEAQFGFYSSVLGMIEKYRVRTGEGDDALEEIIMTSAHGGDPALVLLHYLNRPAPRPGEAVLGFDVDDVEAVVRAAEKAGGTVAAPPKEMPEFGIVVAFVEDLEGHRLELVQRLPAAAEPA
ncbi:VOC family protein [Nocardia elegans]|uniref:VOC family protein n=1 Tax=Nocardia elegans TaxID=300029 RepID=UPI0018947387|nr:VOC family protein [Nocardia elegans]MBF6245599.1 VOC family protein [Nocardia elegans]